MITGPTLPSVRAADALLRRESGGVGLVLLSMLERSAIVAPVLYLAGERRNLFRYTLSVVVAIELVVLATVGKQIRDEK